LLTDPVFYLEQRALFFADEEPGKAAEEKKLKNFFKSR
jgi:hypothetical protein